MSDHSAGQHRTWLAANSESLAGSRTIPVRRNTARRAGPCRYGPCPTARVLHVSTNRAGPPAVRQTAANSAILRRAQQGDRDALDLFFGHHLPLLRTWTAKRIPRWLERYADADDLVQLAAIRTLGRLPHLAEDRLETIQAYMREVVLNLLRDAARRSGRNPDMVRVEEHHATTCVSAFDALCGRGAWQAYAAAKKELSARDCRAVEGRVERGMTYEELTDVLGVGSANTARVTVTRAIARLVKAMCAKPGAVPEPVCRARAARSRAIGRKRATKARKTGKKR